MELIFENKVWEWIFKNKDFLFSGIAFVLIGWLAWIFKWIWKVMKGESDKNSSIKVLKHEHKRDITHIQAESAVLHAQNGSRVVQVKKSATGVIGNLESEIQDYRQKAESLHSSLPVDGFATKFKVPINIGDIYIPLRAMVNLKGIDDIECYGDSQEAAKRLVECNASLEITLLNAFSEAEKRERKALVILGDPGSGKTTHMKRILLWCLHKGPEVMGLSKDMLPVFLPLGELKELNNGLDRFIQDQFTSRHFEMASDFGERLMKRGNLLFLLDGLDEVADLAQRKEVSGWIEEAFTDYPNCRFVVTCRFAGYSPSVRLNEKFLEMHVRPFSETETAQFVHNWYEIVEKNQAVDMDQAKSIAQQKADDLIKRISHLDFRARRVFELTRNPLLLTIICLVHWKQKGQLPTRRVPLYEECIKVLLELWRDVPELKKMVGGNKGSIVLQAVALWLHQEKDRTRVAASDLISGIKPVLKKLHRTRDDAHKFLEIIRDKSGLLTGWDHENYGFMHLNFQEYLAAKEIRSRFLQENKKTGKSDMLKELAKHFGESWWYEVVLLLLGIEEKPSLFVPYMREAVRNPAFAQHADLVEMCLDDAHKPSLIPFEELLELQIDEDQNLSDRQLTALRILMRQDEKARKSVMERFRNHPDERISEWLRHRITFADQDVISPEPSGYELVLIKGGAFRMGSNEKDWGKPVHEVTVPDFYMGRYPVTNKEYGRFIGATGHREPAYWGNREYNQPWQPVVGVSWNDAKAFAQWAGMHLPSEAQWEYACRAGSSTRYYTGDSEEALDRAGWYGKNSDGKLHPVGEKEPNVYGLYDMHGNVWEWCEDHWHDNYNGAPADGSAWMAKRGSDGFLSYFIKSLIRILGKNPGDSALRMLRGGSWNFAPEFCRLAYRDWCDPDFRFNIFGFRLVRLPGQSGEPGRSGHRGAA